MGAVVILGVFVADTTFRAARMPHVGETILGEGFGLGPGGKGSNQAVAAARLGAEVHFISRLGDDAFAAMAHATWSAAGVRPAVTQDAGSYTGAAFIFVDAASGDNAIIISPGAAARIGPADLDAHSGLIRGASVFMAQLEQPLAAAVRGLEIARAVGVTTILNPAPACELPDAVLALCDWVTPNESEAAGLTGLPVESPDAARAAADLLVARGAGGAVITLGSRGALLHGGGISELVPAIRAGALVETTGAGDAFNGGFATGLAEGLDPLAAVRLATAVAAISVTRAGTAPSMPDRAEVEALLAHA